VFGHGVPVEIVRPHILAAVATRHFVVAILLSIDTSLFRHVVQLVNFLIVRNQKERKEKGK
jgi:hypothetical protein